MISGGWLAAFTSPTSNEGSGKPVKAESTTEKNTFPPWPPSTTMTPSAGSDRPTVASSSSSLFLSSALISALEMDSVGAGESSHSTSLQQYEIWEQRTFPLGLEDAAVYLNSLCTARVFIVKIRALMKAYTESGNMPSLSIILQVISSLFFRLCHTDC